MWSKCHYNLWIIYIIHWKSWITHWGWDKMAAIFQYIFLQWKHVIFFIKISLKFVPKGLINNIPSLVQIMAWCRPGDKPLSEPVMVSLLMHICVTQPQWVKWIKLIAFVYHSSPMNNGTYIANTVEIPYTCKTDFRFARSQWETSLQSNRISHWSGADLESALYLYYIYYQHNKASIILYLEISFHWMNPCMTMVSPLLMQWWSQPSAIFPFLQVCWHHSLVLYSIDSPGGL